MSKEETELKDKTEVETSPVSSNKEEESLAALKRPLDEPSKDQGEANKKHKKRHRRRHYDDDIPKESKPLEEEVEEESDTDYENGIGLDDEDEDDLDEIDVSNIITTGRRTRGKVIDFAKAAELLDAEQKAGTEGGEDKSQTPDVADDEDDEDDDAEYNDEPSIKNTAK